MFVKKEIEFDLEDIKEPLIELPTFGEYYEVYDIENNKEKFIMIAQMKEKFIMIAQMIEGSVRNSTRHSVSFVLRPDMGTFDTKKNDYICYQDKNRVYRIASDENKKWAETCQKLNKFVPKEKALKILEQQDFPTTWENYIDYCDRKWNLSKAPYYNDAFETLAKLIELRDYYNKDWEPNWEAVSESKFVIVFSYNAIRKDISWTTSNILSFKSSKTRDLFYDNFKSLIEIAKPLI